MKTITSQNLEGCNQYSYNSKITASEYASLLRFLVMTIKKDFPVEILDNSNEKVTKGQVLDFAINYQEGQEGINDELMINLSVNDGEEQVSFKLSNTGKERVGKSSDSSPKTFYRYYVYSENNEEGYRITFNRRITKK